MATGPEGSDALRDGQEVRMPFLTRMPRDGVSSGAFNAIDGALLEELGYVEDELFCTGVGNMYTYDQDWQLKLARRDVPYTTQIVVRRPADPSRFSGNVVVEGMHAGVVRGQFGRFWDFYAENGDAHVVIMRGPGEAGQARAFSPERYVSLNFPEDGQIWDVLSQVGAALKSDDPANPLAGLGDRWLYLTGASGNAALLLTFLGDGFHERFRMPHGGPIYDAFLPFISHGTTTYVVITTPKHAPTFLGGFAHPFSQIPFGDPRRRVRGHGVPVLQMITEGDMIIPLSPPPLQDFGAPGIYIYGLPPTVESRLFYRRPDGDTPDDRYRLYELAGGGHGAPFVGRGNDFFVRATPPAQRANMMQGFADADYPSYGPRLPMSDLPGRYAALWAWEQLFAWVREGVAPPPSQLIDIDEDQLEIRRDEHGNAVGGLRLPHLDVPLATFTGINPGMILMGAKEPFARDKLRVLYGTHDAYARRFRDRVDELANAGWVLARHVEEMKAEAEDAKTLF